LCMHGVLDFWNWGFGRFRLAFYLTFWWVH
jgi:hypothetical protein